MEKIKFSLQVLGMLIAFPVVMFAELNHVKEDTKKNNPPLEESTSIKEFRYKGDHELVGLHPAWSNEPLISLNY